MLTRLLKKISGQSDANSPAAAMATGDTTLATAEQLPTLSRPNWQPGDIIIGRYRVEQVLSGAMGDIYIAEHLGWQTKMAIKSPKPEVLADREGLQRILTEAQSWVRLGLHPNIATCYYVLNLYQVPHIFIEYIDGGTLADWLKAGRCKDLRTALSLAIQFCHGMEYTHAQGIVHRDIKPQNILITKNALVKITDFGILQSTPQSGGGLEPANPDLETTVGFRGTPAYASPEQFKNTHQVDLRTDIFSFGICLWLLFCGRKPYKNNLLPEELTPQAIEAQPPLPPIMVELLKKTVAFHPDDRYRNFAELRLALNHAYQSYFQVDCPYLNLDAIDLQAESCNNRAVSLFELGKTEEAQKHLVRALELNDIFPEAFFNLLLCKWRQGKSSPSRLLRQLEAVKPRLKKSELLESLAAAIKNRLQQSAAPGGATGEGGSPSNKEFEFPEYRLSPPKKSLEVFREGQLHQSVQRNITNLLTNKRYEACHNVLMQAWSNNGFRKDPVFAEAYDKLLQVGSKKGVIGVQRLLTLRGPGTPVTDLAYLPGSRKIFSTDPRGKLFIRDFGAKPGISVVDKQVIVRTMAISGDGAHLALGDGEGKVSVWSVKTGKIKSSFTQAGAVQALAFSGDGRTLASGGSGGVVKIKTLASGEEKSLALKEGGAIQALTFFPSGSELVTGSEDGSLRFWSAESREPLRIVAAHALPITSLAAAGNGLFFVSGSADRKLKIWDRQTGQCLDAIDAHQDAITSLLILADQRSIVSGCEDDILKVWDAQSSKCVQTLDGRGDGIRALSPGPKPHIFLAGRQDGAVVLWMVIYNLEFDF